MSEIDWSEAPYDSTYWCPKIASMAGHDGFHKDQIPCEKCIPRPTKTEWVDGLPPVGCEFEFRYVSGQWGRAKVDYIGRQVIVFTDDNGAERTEYRHNSENFRPIQTPGQRMREELLSILEDTGYSTHGQADAILKWMKDNNLTEK
jgi:hypothetical protein